MNTKGYIDKKKKGSGIYEDLHLEGIELLQKLSGNLWTDYNEHDPGVTILENLTYAITEQLHKAKLPIKDLLLRKKGEALKSGDNGLFEASDILTTNPITFNDYRKIWIDQVENVKNIWIHIIDSHEGELNNIKGLLQVSVEKYEYESDPEKEKDANRILRATIREVFHKHRNLCEDLYKIEIYRPLELTMKANISLVADANGEEVLANIFHMINDYLAPEVKYYSLWELKKKNIAINHIFNGPRLENGFILDEDLREPLTEIVISEIIKIISKIPEIININDFSLGYMDPETNEEFSIREDVKIPKHTSPKLIFPAENKEIVFENSGIIFNPDLREVQKQLSFLQAIDYGGFKAASNSLNRIPIPTGKYRDMTSYYPLRKQFPELYGIGDFGLSNAATPLRRAQVKQLQAYLMPFDQLLVNFSAQLQNIFNLYDVDTQDVVSYFDAELSDIDQLLDLVKTSENNDNSDEIKKEWRAILSIINNDFDAKALERLHQVTDSLLARYNEEFKTYSLRKINSNSYGEALASQKFEKELLFAKRNFVKDYAMISYNRAKSFNYKKMPVITEGEIVEKEYIPGILQRMAILMGINDFRIRSLTDTISDTGIVVHPRTLEIDIITKEIDIITPDEYIEIEEIEDVVLNEVIEEDLTKVMHYIGSENTILDQVLRRGVLRENYDIRKENIEGDIRYYVMYKRTPNQSNIAHIANSEKAANQAIKNAIDYLIGINQKCEGIYMIEHLLLLPPYHSQYFGYRMDLSLVQEELNINLIQYELSSSKQRNRDVTALLEGMLADQLQYTIFFEHTGYVLEISTQEGEIIAISDKLYATRADLEVIIEKCKEVLCQLDREQLASCVECTVYYGDTNIVDESFFSFQMSYILPSWPVRFQDDNFKRIFENTVYEESPIHIKSTTHWLAYATMDLFETYYYKWLTLLQNNESISEQMYQAYEIITMLQSLENDRG